MKDVIITGLQYRRLKKPCVYFWYRKEECLYVGKSENGILRPLGSHHVIDKTDFMQPDDEIIVVFPEIAVDTPLEQWELYYIDKLKPKYNRLTNYEKLPDHELPSMPEKIYDKKKLAEVLFPIMSHSVLLADSRDYKGTSATYSNLSDEQLKDIILKMQKGQRLIKQLEKINKDEQIKAASRPYSSPGQTKET